MYDLLEFDVSWLEPLLCIRFPLKAYIYKAQISRNTRFKLRLHMSREQWVAKKIMLCWRFFFNQFINNPIYFLI